MDTWPESAHKVFTLMDTERVLAVERCRNLMRQLDLMTQDRNHWKDKAQHRWPLVPKESRPPTR